MKTAYLLNWKEETKVDEEPSWPDYRECARRVRRGESVILPRDFGKRKDVVVGARVYVVKQGKSPTGLIAAGWLESAVESGTHYRSGDEGRAAMVRFDFIIDLGIGERPCAVSEHTLPGPNWKTQISGIDVSEHADQIEACWKEHISRLMASKGNK